MIDTRCEPLSATLRAAHTAYQSTRASKPFSINPAGTVLRRHLAHFSTAVDSKSSDFPAIADGTIRHLLVCRPVRHSDEIKKYQKRYELVGKATTRKEILDLKKAAQRLFTSIRALHAPARAALQLDPTHEQLVHRQKHGRMGFSFEQHLDFLLIHCEHYELPEIPLNAGKGRKPATAEARFAIEAAKVYAVTTGKMPTVISDEKNSYGPFLDFLSELFSIFKIDASPLVHARGAAKAMKKITKKNV